MAGDETAPLLDQAAGGHSDRSSSSSGSHHRNTKTHQLPSESTPLLLRHGSERFQYVEDRIADESTSSRESSVDRLSGKNNRGLSWPSALALLALSLSAITILGLGFATPSVVKQYTRDAADFEPTSLSIADFTLGGVRARVQGTFVLDASRVKTKPVRDLGRLGTWFAREVESRETEVKVYLPEYGNILVGTAKVPHFKVNVRNGHLNEIDILTDLSVGDIAGLRGVANDWLQGRLGQLRVKALSTLNLKSGIVSLGSQTISESLVFKGANLPGFPKVNVTRLNIHEDPNPGHHRAMAADVSVSVPNKYPVDFTIPPLNFEILVPNCSPNDAYILVARATTKQIGVKPNSPVDVDVVGQIQQLPDVLTTICPGRNNSPLDTIFEGYIQGHDTTIYIRGGDSPSSTVPEWIEMLLKSVTIPLPLSGHQVDHLVKNFSMTNVHLSLPEPFADPGTPEAQAKVSALVKAVLNLPKEMNFPLNIPKVRSKANISYNGKEFGYIDLQKWQKANATRIEEGTPSSPALLVEFDIRKAPLQVTDEDTFSEIIQALIFKQESIALQVAAKVDAETDTALGKFVIRDIPGEGEIVIKPPLGGGFTDLKPNVESLEILHTTASSIEVQAKITFTNPTNYSAYVPFVDLILNHNGTDVAHVTGRNILVFPGTNSGVEINGLWNPKEMSGEAGVAAGRDLLSRYVSGFNTTVTLKSFKGTLPALPSLGRALSRFRFSIPVPRLRIPEDGKFPDDDRPHFIKDATMHLLSSTAVFTLLSPFPATTLFITSVDATAFYNHTIPVGRIQYELPFAVPPGMSQTPRLPVDPSLGGAGYEALKKALGGTLKLDAIAEVGIQLQEYCDILFYKGKGIGARVRL
ncbi:hypothetical protein AJ80_00732 [Polytolypa hystricis UAMH7299]|uniref:Pre-rRNA processing protein n=1 Tax=Polytolypa hystricis (strain UAMH7299) TaxID=1447883 RepID=A0A2B7Z2C1_POLH7|nr:hypothetical protein AJ80_00732 [Polytolypa hystricis UAMH7299]